MYNNRYVNPYLYDGYNQVMPGCIYPLPYNLLYEERKCSSMNNTTILELNNQIRRLWEEHITWTRLTIMSIAAGSPDTELVSKRLLQNAVDFGNLFSNFYNPAIAKQFSELMRDHLTIAADLVVAAKKQDNDAVNAIEKKWYENADDISKFLNSINQYWDLNEMKKMMYDHLALTKAEAVAILTNEYEDSIKLFDEIEKQALMMADIYTKGFVKNC